MGTVRRFDVSGELAGPVRMPDGRLRVEGRISRVGVYEYRFADGTSRRELRLPEDVFHADALSSFAAVPVTDSHPPANLTSKTAKRYAVGTSLEGVRADGDKYVAAPLVVFDAETIAKVEAGKQQLSAGYTCELEMTAGTHPTFGKYDAIQRNIRGNHVAIVDAGRAGPDVKLRMDGDAIEVADMTDDDSDSESDSDSDSYDSDSDDERGDDIMATTKRKMDGLDVELSEIAAQAVDKLDRQIAAITADRDREKGRADALEAKLAEAEKARADAADPAKVRAAVTARVALETTARKFLGAGEKLDALDDRGVKAAVILKLTPKAKLDGATDAYIDARYDAAIEMAPTATDGLRIVSGSDGERTDVAERADGTGSTLAAARNRAAAAMANAWKPAKEDK